MENKKGGKMYIQDKVEEYSDEIFDRLDKGGHIYFCGLKGESGKYTRAPHARDVRTGLYDPSPTSTHFPHPCLHRSQPTHFPTRTSSSLPPPPPPRTHTHNQA